MEGTFRRERTYVYTQLIHFTVKQELIQHCKAITLQPIKKFENLETSLPNMLVSLGLRGFLRCGNFSAKTKAIPGKPGWWSYLEATGFSAYRVSVVITLLGLRL